MSEQPKERILSISSCYDCPNRMEMVCLYKPLGMIPMPLGKEAFDYRNRCVCTEKDDQEITNDLPDWCPLPRSRPHPAPAVNRNKDGNLTLTYDEYSLAEHDAAIARKAREDVLDKIMWYMVNHGVEKRPEGYYVISGTFSLGGFIKHIESLRSTQQQAGDP